MDFNLQIAKQFRDLYQGKFAVGPYLKELVEDISYQEATKNLNGCNSIHTLIFHINYYINGVTKVLEGGPLDIRDKYSFDHPAINSEEEWDSFLKQTYDEVEHFAKLIEQVSESALHDDFDTGKYGDIFSNLLVILMHCNYHLGQIAIVKKMLKDG